jgi:hypothetical protein
MSDVINSFLKLRGLLPEDKKKQKEIKKENQQYIVKQESKIHSSMINKIIEEKPKEKHIIKYFQERLKELDERQEDDDD